MKGIVFTTFNEMVTDQYGLDTWETLLQTVKPKSGGVYTTGATYPFEELLAMVIALSNMKNIEIPDLLQTYGEYMFGVLEKKYPMFMQHETLQEFLKSIHGVIHVEVKKLYPDADLPTIKYKDLGPNKIELTYQSPRKLCHLAAGLIHGAAKHYHVTATVKQPVCMHHNADHCCLEVEVR